MPARCDRRGFNALCVALAAGSSPRPAAAVDVPTITLLRVEDAGHDPMRTHQALVARAIRSFLDD